MSCQHLGKAKVYRNRTSYPHRNGCVPYTHYESVKDFEPQAGHYEVELLHPSTNRPVQIRFTLPRARLEEVEVDRDEIDFEHDDYKVEVEFKHNGRVEVDYDD